MGTVKSSPRALGRLGIRVAQMGFLRRKQRIDQLSTYTKQ